MGTPWVVCAKCLGRSRGHKVWFCPHCGYLKPDKYGHRVERLRDGMWKPKVKLPVITPQAARKAERDRLAQDIAKIDRSKLPQLNLTLRKSMRVLPK